MTSTGVAAYRHLAARGGIEDASPHRLIAMLIDGALARLSRARGHIQRNEIVQKGESLSETIDIVGELGNSLDHARGAEISRNLASLYDYMSRRLVHANRNNDIAAVNEVADLIREIRDAWDAIAPNSSSITTLASVR